MACLDQRQWKVLGSEGNVESIVSLSLSRVIAKKSVPSVINEKHLLE